MTRPDSIDVSQARRLARAALEAEPSAVLYVDTTLRPPGTVSVGPKEVHVDRPALLAFRDEMPGANWMHPCTYALIDPENGEVLTTEEAERPPQFGFLPETWVLAAGPDRQADLLPPSHQSREEP